MKLGLALEGGGMRGMYTAAVLDVFLKRGLKVDGAIGVSAGALFGVNYISGQEGRALRYNKKYNVDKNYMGIRPFIKERNIINTKYAYEDVPMHLDPFDNEAFVKSEIPFYAVVTNVKTGKPEYILIEDVFKQMDVLRASASMPFFSKPVEINGELYLDGGICDSIPFQWILDDCDKLIVVLTRNKEYRKEPMSDSLIKLYSRKYPKVAEKLKVRHEMYNNTVALAEKMQKEGKLFIIRPSEPINIKRLERDPESLQAVYNLGIKDINNYWESLDRYINN